VGRFLALALVLAGLAVACGGGQRVEHDYQVNVSVQIAGAVTVSGSRQGGPIVGQSQHACADSVKERAYLIPSPSVGGHQAQMGVIPVRTSPSDGAGTFKIDGPLTIDGREFNLTDTGSVTLQPDGGGRLQFANSPAVPPATGAISGSIAWTCKDVTRTIG
jgi:hypothetical protein